MARDLKLRPGPPADGGNQTYRLKKFASTAAARENLHRRERQKYSRRGAAHRQSDCDRFTHGKGNLASQDPFAEPMSTFHEKAVADKVSLICDRWRRGLPLFEAPLPAPD